MNPKLKPLYDKTHDCQSCAGCGDHGHGAAAMPGPPAEVPRLVAPAAVFLLPILMAVAGSILMRASANTQVIGAFSGGAIGVIAARLLVSLRKPEGGHQNV